ncbi:fungal-specific transcription factor domain-containing protein [Lipomyces arxii]|uniref:fungal-specific transcription factor domain-containing protein n=1 Tax=Lipomyces arxii TaxID=56418 RepID=UPI0034CF4AAC
MSSPGNGETAADDGIGCGGGLSGGSELELSAFEAAELKKRRIARACDCCRKRKVRCDGQMPSCANCINYKTECVFTYTERKKRNPAKGAKYIESLESRLEKMEDLISAFVPEYNMDANDDPAEFDSTVLNKIRDVMRSKVGSVSGIASASVDGSIKSVSPATHDSVGETGQIPEQQHANDEAEDNSGTRSSNGHEATSFVMKGSDARFIGHSSVFTLFSPRGLQWIAEKLGNTTMQDVKTGMFSFDDTNCERFEFGEFDVTHLLEIERNSTTGAIFKAQDALKSLPGYDTVTECIDMVFKIMWPILPIFTIEDMYKLRDTVMNNSSKCSRIEYCALNAIVANGIRLRTFSGSNLHQQGEQGKSKVDDGSWLYFKNAIQFLTELICGSHSMLGVQTLVCLALYLEGSDTPEAAYMIASNATRIALSIGLHYGTSGFRLLESEAAARKRMFWICYILDKSFALRSNRPPAIVDEEILIDEPTEADGSPTMFCIIVRFAKIQSKTFRRLYSSAVANISEAEIVETIGELDRELLEWRDSMPLEYRPDHEIVERDPLMLIHYVYVHFGYYNCLTAIHRMSIHHATWRRRRSGAAEPSSSPNPRVFASAALCVQAARSTIYQLRYFENFEQSCGWLVVYYTMTSLVTLFANCLQNPERPTAESDVALMSSAAKFITRVIESSDYHQNNIAFVTLLSELVRLAGMAVQRAEDARERKKRIRLSSAVPPAVPLPVAVAPPSSVAPIPDHYTIPAEAAAEYDNCGSGVIPSENTVMYNSMEAGAVLDGRFISEQPFIPTDMWNLPTMLNWDWGTEPMTNENSN